MINPVKSISISVQGSAIISFARWTRETRKKNGRINLVGLQSKNYYKPTPSSIQRAQRAQILLIERFAPAKELTK